VTKSPLASSSQSHIPLGVMLGALRRILVLMLAIALALAGSGGSMAGIAASSHSHSSMSASLAENDDEHRQAHEVDYAAPGDVSVGISVGAVDLGGDGAESSCCVMCQTAVEMSFPAIVPTCLGSLRTPWAQKAARAGLSDPLERPPRVS
jgi:hypothetical protein